MSASKSSDLKSLLQLGSLLLNVKKDLVKSGDVFRRCIAENPDDFRAYYNLGTVLDETQDYEGAASSFKRAIERDGRVPESYGCLGGVLLKLRRPREAVKVCRDGLLVVPTDSPCLYNLNVALRQLSRMNEAIDLCFRILQISCSIDVGAPGQQLEAEDDHQITATTITRSSKAEGVVFICVKWGSKYDADYVNAMYRALKRHWTRTDGEMRLICMTDDTSGITSEVECKPFPPAAASGGWRAWWLKACIFSPAVMEELGVKRHGSWVFYLDLDTVICGDLDFLTSKAGIIDWSRLRKDTMCTFGTAMFSNEERDEGINSSVLLWYEPPSSSSSSADPSLSRLFSLLEQHYKEIVKVVYKFDHFLEMFLSRLDIRVVHLENTLSSSFADYHRVVSHDCVNDNSNLATVNGELGIEIVCFPLEPKPKAVQEKHRWIREYFLDGGEADATAGGNK
jgi:hypothetical protein